MSDLADKHVLVVGLGASGSAAARVLAAAGARVRVSEQRNDVAELADLRRIGAEVLTGGHEPSHLDGIDLVVVSPGVFASGSILAWAIERAQPIGIPRMPIASQTRRSAPSWMTSRMNEPRTTASQASAKIGYGSSASGRSATARSGG